MSGKNGAKIRNAAIFFLKRTLFKEKQTQKEDDLPPEEEEEENLFLPQIREITKEILKKRKIPYHQFMPVIIDGKDSGISLLAAELLSKDLNHLIILTDRPAYFEEFADNLYEEQGLIAEIFFKSREKIEEIARQELYGNLILDFEERKKKSLAGNFEKKIYIPVFKRQWEQSGNLDIAVPIGYNTMIVRGSENPKTRHCLDKFERAFYENE